MAKMQAQWGILRHLLKEQTTSQPVDIPIGHELKAGCAVMDTVPRLPCGDFRCVNVEIKAKSMAERLFGPTFSVLQWNQPLEPVLGQFENAIKTDNVEQLDQLINTTHPQTYRLIVHDVWQIAVKHGQLDMLNLLYDRTPSLQLPGSQILIPAVKSGSIEVLCWLREKSQTCISDFGVMHEAICAGRVEVVAWLIQQSSDDSWWRQGYFCLDCPMDNLAVSKGHVHLASWLFRKFCWISRQACDTIVQHQFDKFQAFVEQSNVVAFGIAESAVQLGEIDVLKRLFEHLNDKQQLGIADNTNIRLKNWTKTAIELYHCKKQLAQADAELYELKDSKRLTCVVCMARTITCRLDPCGHVALCETCLRQLSEPKKCPVCRQPIEQTQQCFFPS